MAKSKAKKKVQAVLSSSLGRTYQALKVEQVFSFCTLDLFSDSLAKKNQLDHEIIAQPRVKEALKMGLSLDKPGYNIYVSGDSKTGKTSVLESFINSMIKKTKLKIPADWIYVYNYEEPKKPLAIKLEAGRGRDLSKAMDQALHELRFQVPLTLLSKEYEDAVNHNIALNNEKQSQFFSELEKIAKKLSFQIKSTKMGIETLPVKEGRILSEKDYGRLREKERKKIEQDRMKISPKILEFARKVRSLDEDSRKFAEILKQETCIRLVSEIFFQLEKKFKDHKEITEYLQATQTHILENIDDFIELESHSDETFSASARLSEEKEKFSKYKINVFIDNKELKSPPVVIEKSPSFYNLFGKKERSVELGLLKTDFTKIQAGSLHRANGGFLLLEASAVLKLPYIWDTLKRALRSQQGFIEDLEDQASVIPTSGITPKPIDLNVKVLLMGSDEVYRLLFDLDQDFSKVFKIKAEFQSSVQRNKSNVQAYQSFVNTRVLRENLLSYDKGAHACIVEYGSRLCEDQNQLSTHFGDLKDLTIESHYLALQAKSSKVKRTHVEEAILMRHYRVNLYEHELLDMFQQKQILLSSKGKVIGQMNALTVYDIGDYSFGRPARITCTVAVNDHGIINIERDCKLSGNSHNKGVLILSSFLSALLAREQAIGLSASLCFEQSYGPIDGDSASMVELLTLVSAMSGVPIQQNVSMTASLNQRGEAQPIGSINEKIEGLWRSWCSMKEKSVCKVVIPKQNISHLMLDKETREAIKAGNLQIFPVSYFWEAFEIATDCEFGAQSLESKSFAKDSALGLIKERLNKIRALEEEVPLEQKTS